MALPSFVSSISGMPLAAHLSAHSVCFGPEAPWPRKQPASMISPVYEPDLVAAMLWLWPSILCSALSSVPLANATAATTSDSIANDVIKRFMGGSSWWIRPGSSGTAACGGPSYGCGCCDDAACCGTHCVPPRAGGGDSGHLQVLEVERAVQATTLPAKPVAAAAQRLARNVDDRQAE